MRIKHFITLLILPGFLILGVSRASPFKGQGQQPLTTKAPKVDLCLVKDEVPAAPKVDTKSGGSTGKPKINWDFNGGVAKADPIPADSRIRSVDKRNSIPLDPMANWKRATARDDKNSGGGLVQAGIITDEGSQVTKIQIDLTRPGSGEIQSPALDLEESASNSISVGQTAPFLIGDNPTQVSGNQGIQHQEFPEMPVTPLTPESGNQTKDGICRSLSEGLQCLKLTPESSQCKGDGECPGNKKCCFYGCPPWTDVGVCEVPIYEDDEQRKR